MKATRKTQLKKIEYSRLLDAVPGAPTFRSIPDRRSALEVQ